MTAALEGGEWSAARPGRTLPPRKTRYPFYRRLGGPQGRSGRAENLVPTGIRSRTIQPIAQSLYSWQPPSGPRPPHFRGFTITLRHTTFGKTPLDEWSARRRDLYFTAHNTHKRQTPIPPAGLEPAIPASEQPQSHALDSARSLLHLRQIPLKMIEVQNSLSPNKLPVIVGLRSYRHCWFPEQWLRKRTPFWRFVMLLKRVIKCPVWCTP